MAAELEAVGVEGEDFNIVTKGDKTLIIPIRKSPDDPYDSDPQIRAFQMVQEGRIGGSGRGQGRKRKPRAAEHVAEEVRKRSGKIVAALDAGLEADSVRTRLEAAGMALKIERDEAVLQLKEYEVDLDQMGKDELLAELVQLVADPSTEAQLEAVIDLPPSAIEEVSNDDTSVREEDGKREAARGAVATSDPPTTRPNLRAFGGNGRRPAPRNRAKGQGSRTARSDGRATD